MDDSMKKALGECVVFRKIPRLIRGMSLLLCLLAISLPEVQADPWKQKRLMETENTALGEKSVLSSMNMHGTARSVAKEIQQQKTVSVRIVDEQGEPVIGANVVEKGTTNGTVTDADGRFSLSVVPNGVLHVSYIGYLDEEVQVSGRTSVNITLREDTQSLEEVVVVAYGTSKRSVFTGSAASVDHAKLQSPNASFDKSLQGQVAGLQVMSASGQPGSTSSFRIRGSGSLNASNEPLYVVDGVPISANTKYSKLAEDNSNSSSILATLNPQDIESVTVLKDASAASLYGSRAANPNWV